MPKTRRDPLVAAFARAGMVTPGELPALARPTTTEQGLGWQHQQDRLRLLATTPENWPCPGCGMPMHPKTDPSSLDADHSVPRSLGGQRADRLMHSSCNRRSGAQLRRSRRRTPRAVPLPPSGPTVPGLTAAPQIEGPRAPSTTTRRW